MQQTLTKWADFVIVAVRYNEHHTHIVEVEVKPDDGRVLGTSQYWPRSAVVAQIEFWRHTFVTGVKTPSGWNRGETVRIVQVGYTKYIRTDSNSTAADNLGSLPEF